MRYILTNRKGAYIRLDPDSKKYVPIKNKNFCTYWDDRSKAANILKSSLTKKLKETFFVEAEDPDFNANSVNSNASEIKPNGDKASSGTVKSEITGVIDQRFSNLISEMDRTESFFLDVDARYAHLGEDLSTVDREITDLNHYIEFNDLNACNGFKMYKELQGRLRRRRAIKDEIRVLSSIRCCKIAKSEINEVRRTVYELSQRKYAPRELTELF